MNIIYAIAKFISGIIATVGGIFSLIFNDMGYCLYNSMSEYGKTACSIVIVGVGVFLIVVSIIDFISSLKNQLHHHKLKFHSKKYIKYFTKWYKTPGSLSIICDDLDWVRNNINNDIYLALIDKSKQNNLFLYLGEGFNSETTRELCSYGAVAVRAPERIINIYTWSCLSIMGNSASKIIVRNKQNDNNGYVIIDEICNTYVTGLLNELLDWREQTCNSEQEAT